METEVLPLPGVLVKMKRVLSCVTLGQSLSLSVLSLLIGDLRGVTPHPAEGWELNKTVFVQCCHLNKIRSEGRRGLRSEEVGIRQALSRKHLPLSC